MTTAIHPTNIPWAHCVWNPGVGCLRHCEYCYAWREGRGFAWRFAATWTRLMGRTGQLADETIDKFKRFLPQFFPERMGLRHPNGKTIFINSMSDPAYWHHTWIQAVLDEIAQHPENTYVLLSKSPLYLCDYELPPNLLYGITITNQDQMDEVIAQGNTEAYDVVYYEPLLEAIDTSDFAYNPKARIIIGAETGQRTGKVIPKREWVEALVWEAVSGSLQLHIKPSIYALWPEFDIPEWEEMIR